MRNNHETYAQWTEYQISKGHPVPEYGVEAYKQHVIDTWKSILTKESNPKIIIGKYEIEKLYTNSDGAFECYDVIIRKDNKQQKNIKQCIGPKSAEHWKEYALLKIKRLDILNTRLEMVLHNMMCYSTNVFHTEPKVGYESEYKLAFDEADTLEFWIKEIESNI